MDSNWRAMDSEMRELLDVLGKAIVPPGKRIN